MTRDSACVASSKASPAAERLPGCRGKPVESAPREATDKLPGGLAAGSPSQSLSRRISRSEQHYRKLLRGEGERPSLTAIHAGAVAPHNQSVGKYRGATSVTWSF